MISKIPQDKQNPPILPPQVRFLSHLHGSSYHVTRTIYLRTNRSGLVRVYKSQVCGPADPKNHGSLAGPMFRSNVPDHMLDIIWFDDAWFYHNVTGNMMTFYWHFRFSLTMYISVTTILFSMPENRNCLIHGWNWNHPVKVGRNKW